MSFHIISSLRYDPSLPSLVQQLPPHVYPDPLHTPYYLLPYHLDRLRDAAECFHWPKAQAFLSQDSQHLVQFLDSFIPDSTKSWRLRILLDRDGSCTVEANPAAPMNIEHLLLPSDTTTPSQSPVYRVYVDSQPTIPSAFTTHKTTARDNYTASRTRAGIASPQDTAEVLIVNPDGEVMEGSITTVYFRRRRPGPTDPLGEAKDWITPPLTSGGNSSTTRRYALAQGFCSEEVVSAADLVDGEECWLSNGVRGFLRGKVILSPGVSTSTGSNGTDGR